MYHYVSDWIPIKQSSGHYKKSLLSGAPLKADTDFKVIFFRHRFSKMYSYIKAPKLS